MSSSTESRRARVSHLKQCQTNTKKRGEAGLSEKQWMYQGIIYIEAEKKKEKWDVRALF